MAAILEQTDFTRISWPLNSEVWKERTNKVALAWKEVEILSVLDGVRECAFVFMSAGELDEYIFKYKDLKFLALQKVPKREEYINSGVPYQEGQPFDLRVAVAKDKDTLDLFQHWWDKRDDHNIGYFLGFPECCINNFIAHWGRGYRDPIFAQLKEVGASGIELTSYNFSCNLMLRYLGVRAVPHLPCSMRCDETETLAYQLGGVFRKYGFDQENEWLKEMLKMPMQYSTLHGICEIVSPFCKITASSDDLNVKHWMTLKAPIVNLDWYDEVDTWTANGFKSKADMDSNHQFIIDLAKGIKYDSILDLGCGNGELVKKLIQNKYGSTTGVDLVMHPNRILGTHRIESIDKFLTHPYPNTFNLALIAEQRLDESGNRNGLLQKVRTIAKYVIVYNYNGMSDTYLGIVKNRVAALVPGLNQ